MFFKNEDNAKVLASFLRKAEAAHIEDESRAMRLSISREIIGYIYKSPEGWEERCTFNIKHIGDQFLQWLRDFDQSKPTHIDHIYCMSYRFLCEFDFLVGPGKELSMELRSLKSKIEHDSGKMDDDVRSQIIYASYVMPANIAKDFINDANIGVFKDFEQKKLEAEKLKEQWDGEITSKESAANALKDKLEEYKIGFNFVGLYQGFSALAEKKAKEAFWLFLSLIGMGLLILAPLVTEIVLSVVGIYSGKPLGMEHLLILIPVISIEIILIYFFRVILLNHRSVKAQIMQIELRQTLCQFIQSYTGYSSEMKKQDSSALEKFESLIFSGVLSDPEKLPSTFDGVEQIGNLIKSIKNS
ncbi:MULTISPECIES: hypothetical protein [unclassified Pseudoalteromonas]|uniref:hypothetical protein n=2 Tax=Pseudoalteromonas TaxID=53246 RepID=UPI00051A7231|nr:MULTISPECIES: hypothetical protein [unclassified Pseudoalteromonas]KGK01406.1 hypothetical protein ND6B_1931 [Pseudoalteromonas sp. ND6B]